MTRQDDPAPTNDDALAAYLAEHWTAMRAGVEVAQRLADEDALRGVDGVRRLAADFDADYLAFDQMLADLDLTDPQSGPPTGVLGDLVADSATSPLLGAIAGPVLGALSALGASIEAKRALWTTLQILAQQDTRLSEPQLHALTERALEQHQLVENLRRTTVTRGRLTDE